MPAVANRVYRGSKAQDIFQTSAPAPSLASIDSAFQLQEYIAYLIREDPHNVDTIVKLPEHEGHEPLAAEETTALSSEDSYEGNSEDKSVDEKCWIYEQIRRVCRDLSHPWVITLQTVCNKTTCPEMKAVDWLYMCVAHGGTNGIMESNCCAIDYIVHTLDSAIAILNSPRSFPSRMSIPAASLRHFYSLARRLSRIFAHAYYHHREMFEMCEAETSLYSRFYKICRVFDLVAPEFLIPPRMVGTGASGSADEDFDRHSFPHPDASLRRMPSTASLVPDQRQDDGQLNDDIPEPAAPRPEPFSPPQSSMSASSPRSLVDRAAFLSHPSNDSAEHIRSLIPLDTDGDFDLVEGGLAAQSLGEMMAGITGPDEDDEDDDEDEDSHQAVENVVVDEVDVAPASPIAGSPLSPRRLSFGSGPFSPNSAAGPHHLDIGNAEGTTSALPVLEGTGLSPRDEKVGVSSPQTLGSPRPFGASSPSSHSPRGSVNSSPSMRSLSLGRGGSPLNTPAMSPRRSGTLRQVDFSPRSSPRSSTKELWTEESDISDIHTEQASELQAD